MAIVLDNMRACGVYLGGNAGAVYRGGDIVWRRSYPALRPGTLRIRFSDTTYDPSSAPAGTWENLGWTLTRVSHEPNIWDFYHPTDLPDDSLLPMANKSASAVPVTASYFVDEVIPHSSWLNFCGLFSEHHYLVRCTEFFIPAASGTQPHNLSYMFYNCSSLTNDIAWARHIGSRRQIQEAGDGTTARGAYVYGTPNAASIPMPLGGTKARVRIVSKTGSGPFLETFTATFQQGDWCYIAARGYSSATHMSYGYITTRSSGNPLVTSRTDSSSRIMTVTATGSTGNKATGSFTVRWGYSSGSRMYCANCKRQAYSSNNPYANVYIDSYQFM